MRLLSSGTWEAIEPGTPVLLFVAIEGLVMLLDVHSNGDAVLLGAGFGCAMVLATVLYSRRRPAPVPRPLLQHRHLPWGIAYGLVGAAMMLTLGEPWEYWGAGILAIGVLYVASGAAAILRDSWRAAK